MSKIDDNGKVNLSNRLKENLVDNENIISGLSNQQQSKYLIDDINFNDFKNTRITKQNSNSKSNTLTANDKVSTHSYTCLCHYSSLSSFFLLLLTNTYKKNKIKEREKKVFFLILLPLLLLLFCHSSIRTIDH